MYSNIPVICSYKDIQHRFTNTTPVRGEHKSIRRLSTRTHKYKLIKRLFDEELGEYYQTLIYNQPAVAFYPDFYEIDMTSGYVVDFVRDLLPHYCENVSQDVVVPRGFAKLAEIPALQEDKELIGRIPRWKYNGHYLNRNRKFKFGYDHHPYTKDDVLQTWKLKVNRSKMKAVRNEHKDVLEYFTAMAKLMPQVYKTWKERSVVYENYLAAEDSKHKAFLNLFYYSLERITDENWNAEYVYNETMMKKLYDKKLKESHPEVLERAW